MPTSLLETIVNNAGSIIAAIDGTGDYNYDWGASNIEDLAHCTFPNAVIQAVEEENLDEDNGAHSQAYQNGVSLEIKIRHINASEDTNPNYAIRARLFRALDDIKRAFGNNCSLSGAGDCMLYRGSTFDITRIGNDDIFIPYEMTSMWYIRYTQDRKDPDSFA